MLFSGQEIFGILEGFLPGLIGGVTPEKAEKVQKLFSVCARGCGGVHQLYTNYILEASSSPAPWVLGHSRRTTARGSICERALQRAQIVREQQL